MYFKKSLKCSKFSLGDNFQRVFFFGGGVWREGIFSTFFKFST